MAEEKLPAQSLPQSLGSHVVPEERAELVRAHIRTLAATALEVSDSLPFSADTSDFLRVLEDEAE